MLEMSCKEKNAGGKNLVVGGLGFFGVYDEAPSARGSKPLGHRVKWAEYLAPESFARMSMVSPSARHARRCKGEGEELF